MTPPPQGLGFLLSSLLADCGSDGFLYFFPGLPPPLVLGSPLKKPTETAIHCSLWLSWEAQKGEIPPSAFPPSTDELTFTPKPIPNPCSSHLGYPASAAGLIQLSSSWALQRAVRPLPWNLGQCQAYQGSQMTRLACLRKEEGSDLTLRPSGTSSGGLVGVVDQPASFTRWGGGADDLRLGPWWG